MNDAVLVEADDSRTRPQGLIGTWRRFGPVGPVYEVIAAGEALPAGDRRMRIRVLETAEEVDYRLSAILADLPAR